MFNKKKEPPIKSLIGEGTAITGDITFSDGLRVDGKVQGNIRASEEMSSILVISEVATVLGEITADHIVINGAVQGPIHARKMLELQPKARIDGDVRYAALEMHQGALVTGQLSPLVNIEVKPILKLESKGQ